MARRTMAEVEWVLGRVLKQVEKSVGREIEAAQLAAAKQAQRAYKQQRRDEAEVRGVLEALLGRVERQVVREEKEAVKRAALEEAAAARQAQRATREAQLAEFRAAKDEAAQAKQAQREAARAAAEEQMALRAAAGLLKRTRCGKCAGCLAPNCGAVGGRSCCHAEALLTLAGTLLFTGACSSCLDMPQFGGPGSKRQPCKMRICTAPRMCRVKGAEEKEEVVDIRTTWLQCDTCNKWRIVPDLPGIVPEGEDAVWYCHMNVDKRHNTCDVPQQPDDAVLGQAPVYPKVSRTAVCPRRMSAAQPPTV